LKVIHCCKAFGGAAGREATSGKGPPGPAGWWDRMLPHPAAPEGPRFPPAPRCTRGAPPGCPPPPQLLSWEYPEQQNSRATEHPGVARMPASQHTLTFAASDAEKTTLGGDSERYFVRIENALGVRLLTRNAGVTVQAGNETAARKAIATLAQMRETLKSGQQLSEYYVDELLNLGEPHGTDGAPRRKGGAKAAVKDARGELVKAEPKPFVPSLEKPILIDRYGKPVQPKTRGQARFLQVIRDHDIVFRSEEHT